MKQALELFSSKSYLKAEKLFLQAGAQEALEAKKYLFLISKNLNKADMAQRYNAYLYELSQKNESEAFLEFHEQYKRELESRNWAFLLDALWNTGRVEEFNLSLRKIWIQIIERKMYCWPEVIFQTAKNKNPFLLHNYFSYLVYLVETAQSSRIVETTSELLALIEKKWERVKSPGKTKLECFEKLLSIFENAPTKDEALEGEIFKAKRVVASAKGSLMKPRPLMEYIIFFKNNLEELVLLARAGVIQNPEAFIRTLVQDPKLMQEKPNLPANLQKTLRPLVKYSIKKEIPSKKIDNAVPEPVQDWQTLTTQIVSTGGSQPAPSDYVASLSEKEILAGIKAEDPQFLEDNGGLVHSLIGVGFFKAALELLRIKKNDPRFFYLKCHTLLELGKYHELIDYIEFIFSFKLGEEEEVPFYYIMALAYLALKRKESARACFKRVVKIDPNFRNAKELLLSAKAE